MRKRELIAQLKADERQLRHSYTGIFSGKDSQQRDEECRLKLRHDLERLLPEIIEKLEG